MKNIIFIILTVFFLSGCGVTKITIPIDSSLISKDEATIIVFHDQGFPTEFKILMNGMPIGVVNPEVPLKFSVLPEKYMFTVKAEKEYMFYIELPFVIHRETKQYFEAGKTYFMRVWFKRGLWVGSIRIDPVDKIDSYETTSNRQ